MDLTAPCDGRVGPHLAVVGDVIEVGTTVVVIEGASQ
jgi:pyruvate/2-oxoglutarate dehydrogenase complex dihydrolipoamide acyltransferase (E2) component